MGIGRFAFTPILPMMQADGLLSVSTGGWLASANYAGYLVGALTAAVVRASPRRMIRGSLVAIAVTTLAMALTPTFVAWIVLRVLAGVASAWVLVSVSAWALGVLAALRRPRLGGVVFAGVGVGIAVAGALCLVLMHAGTSSATAWATLGAVALLATAVIWRGVGAGSTVSPTPPAARAPRTRARADTARLVVCYGIFGFGYIVPATFLPAMARQEIRDPLVFGWSWPLFGAAAAVSTLAIAFVPRTIDSRWQWAASQALLAVGVALPALRPGLFAIMLAALLVGGTFLVITMLGMQEARRVAGEHATALMAAMTSAFAAGQIAGPLMVSGLVAMGGTVGRGLEFAAFLVAVSAVALVVGAPSGERDPESVVRAAPSEAGRRR
jgi:predicted MFS family arabinose efflux permease